MAEDIVIRLENVSKMYKLFATKTERMKEALHPLKRKYHKEFYALKDINLEVRHGEILGIIGMNGSGKSTLLKIVAGIIQSTTGTISVQGNVVPLLELGSGFNPEFSGLDNIYFYNSILGRSRKETNEIVGKILDFAEIGDFIHQPLKTYSSGMKARLSFAVSVFIDPDILIVDEILSVGDELFRRKSFAKIEEFFKAGKTILFVSHSEGNINQLCSRVVMLNEGRIVLQGTPKVVTMHYTKFIFSQPSERKALLDDFKRVNTDADLLVGKSTTPVIQKKIEVFPVSDANAVSKPYLIPNFQSKSMVITSNAQVKVHNLKIETLTGQQVNSLVQHEEFVFSYLVDYYENVGLVNIGIGFRTEKGVPLSWRVVPNKNRFLEREMKSGDSIQVKWKFKCLFMPGTYYINTAIKKRQDMSEELVFRGQDIFVFRVQGVPKEKGGLFDAGISLTLSDNN
jgi:lipopolysaccharide transport system ATP-binding protein